LNARDPFRLRKANWYPSNQNGTILDKLFEPELVTRMLVPSNATPSGLARTGKSVNQPSSKPVDALTFVVPRSPATQDVAPDATVTGDCDWWWR